MSTRLPDQGCLDRGIRRAILPDLARVRMIDHLTGVVYQVGALADAQPDEAGVESADGRFTQAELACQRPEEFTVRTRDGHSDHDDISPSIAYGIGE